MMSKKEILNLSLEEIDMWHHYHEGQTYTNFCEEYSDVVSNYGRKIDELTKELRKYKGEYEGIPNVIQIEDGDYCKTCSLISKYNELVKTNQNLQEELNKHLQ